MSVAARASGSCISRLNSALSSHLAGRRTFHAGVTKNRPVTDLGESVVRPVDDAPASVAGGRAPWHTYDVVRAFPVLTSR